MPAGDEPRSRKRGGADGAEGRTAVMDLALGMLRADQFVESEKLLRDLIARDPGARESSLRLLGYAMEGQGRLAEAEAAYRDGIASGGVGAHKSLGVLLLKMDRHAEAEASLRRFLELEPSTEVAGARLALGKMLVARGQHAEAEVQLAAARAAATGEEAGNAAIALGNLYGQLGRREEAESCYLDAVACFPIEHSAQLMLDVALMLITWGRVDTAETLLTQAIPRASGTVLAMAQRNLAVLLERRGDDDGAVVQLQHALDGADVEVARRAANGLGDIYLRMGRIDEAADLYRRALADGEGDQAAVARLNLARAAVVQGDAVTAMAGYQALSDLDGELGNAARIGIAVLLNNAGLAEEAESELEEVLAGTQDPYTTGMAMHNLAATRLLQEPFEEAAELFERVLDSDPANLPGAQLGRAMALKGLGRHREANVLLERVKEVGPPGSAEAIEHIERLLPEGGCGRDHPAGRMGRRGWRWQGSQASRTRGGNG